MLVLVSVLVSLGVIAAMLALLAWTYRRGAAMLDEPQPQLPRQRRASTPRRLGPDPVTDDLVSRGGLGVSAASYQRYVERGMGQLSDYIAEDPAGPPA
jgi:hypothetical protein